MLCALAALSLRQELVYGGLEALYLDTMAKNPSGWAAYSNLGVFYENQGRHDDAYPFFRKATELNPGDVTVQSNMGPYSPEAGDRDGLQAGQLETAFGHFRKALEIDPRCVPRAARTGRHPHSDESPCRGARAVRARARLSPQRPAQSLRKGSLLGALGATRRGPSDISNKRSPSIAIRPRRCVGWAT